MKLRRFVTAFMLLVAAALFVGCGNSGGTTQSPPPPPQTVTVTCAGSIQIGVISTNYDCTASEAVTWTVNNTALATISSSGILTPNTTTTGTVTVTATPTTGSDKPGTATVNVVDQIIYGEGGLQTIDLVNSDDSDPIQLTTGCGDPEFFYDHTQFVCTGVTGNNLLIYKSNGTAAGTTLSATLTWSNLGQPDDASPSPNGKTLVFRAYDTTVGKFGVYQANVDGTNLQLLSQEVACTGSCVGIGQPRYSYDGTKIVYTHVVAGQSMVCTMTATGANQSCLTAGGDGAFSTDGTTIFFTEADGIHSIGSTGGRASALIVAGSGGAMSSPNGLKLVFGTASGISTSYIDGSGQQTLVTGAGHGSW